MSQTNITEGVHSQAWRRSFDDHRDAGPSIDIAFASPDYTPDLSRVPTVEQDDNTHEGLRATASRGHMGTALENLASAMTNTSYAEPAEDTYELRPTLSHRVGRKSSIRPVERVLSHLDGLAEEVGSPTQPIRQGVPPELGSLTKEIIFVLVCSCGQLLFALNQGDVNVNQQAFKNALALQSTELPWLNGALLVALGLTVIVAGSLTDLAPPKLVVVGALGWLTLCKSP